MATTSKIRRFWNPGILAICLFVATFAFSCKDDDKDNFSGFVLDEDSFSFSENGGVGELKVKAGQEWTAATSAEWCMVSPANGNADALCEIRVDSSYLYDAREATVTFYSGTETKQVKINQFGYKKEIRISETAVDVPDYAPWGKTFFNVKITANVSYEIVIPQDQEWLKCKQPDFNPISIPRPSTVRFDYDYNVKPLEKVALVELRGKGPDAGKVDPVVLTVRQSAAPYIEKGTRKGDSLALIAISRGLNSMVSWDLSRSMISWNDVLTEEITYTDKNGDDSTDLRVVGVRFIMFSTKTSLPYEVSYLTECRTFIALGNENGFLRSIALGSEITTLPKLKSLSLMGYGISSLPEEISQMESLEELDLSGNTFMELPVDIVTRIPKLTYFCLSGNRRHDGIMDLSNEKRDSIGLRGELPAELFKIKTLRDLQLGYNYFEGSIPDMPLSEVSPNLEVLKLSLNRLSGKIPNWILNHPNLGCWDPYVLIFNQEGKDSNGKACAFTNEPPTSSIPECPLVDKDKSPSQAYIVDHYQRGMALSLKGNWAGK